MTKADRILQRMRNNPRDWRIEDLEVVARRLDMVVRRSPGSHVVFQHRGSALEVTVPARHPIKPVYVRKFLDLVAEVEVANEV